MKKWMILIGCMTMMGAMLQVSAQDFGDFSSQTLTGKAWEAYGKGNFELALTYTAKCKEMYMSEALKQEASLDAFPVGEGTHEYWALNDVGTCLFIEGQIYEKQKNITQALEVYAVVVNQLSFSQCWDEKGWFWKPAEASAGRIKQLEFDSLLD
ncbi:beta-glucanase precursor [Kiritimatiellota bacterium B12222]|nr:beta-glucanase precursor [Kiritimatiellota bacterium B12222]